MALRLAGEEFSVVRGLDSQGWPREIEASDALPGVKITQSGSGPAAKVVSGDVDLNNNLLKNAKLGTTLNANSQKIDSTASVVIGVGIAGDPDTVRLDRVDGAGGYFRVSMWGPNVNHSSFQNPLVAQDGVATKVKAGAILDTDFVWVDNGMLAIDSTNGRLYFRYGGSWHYVAQTV